MKTIDYFAGFSWNVCWFVDWFWCRSNWNSRHILDSQTRMRDTIIRIIEWISVLFANDIEKLKKQKKLEREIERNGQKTEAENR